MSLVLGNKFTRFDLDQAFFLNSRNLNGEVEVSNLSRVQTSVT